MEVLKLCENYASERPAVGCIAWLGDLSVGVTDDMRISSTLPGSTLKVHPLLKIERHLGHWVARDDRRKISRPAPPLVDKGALFEQM